MRRGRLSSREPRGEAGAACECRCPAGARPRRMSTARWRRRNGYSTLRHPLCDKQVCLTGPGVVPVGGPHERAAVRAEHREAVERRLRRHLFETTPVEIHQKEIVVAAAWTQIVRREDQTGAVGRPRRAEV